MEEGLWNNAVENDDFGQVQVLVAAGATFSLAGECPFLKPSTTVVYIILYTDPRMTVLILMSRSKLVLIRMAAAGAEGGVDIAEFNISGITDLLRAATVQLQDSNLLLLSCVPVQPELTYLEGLRKSSCFWRTTEYKETTYGSDANYDGHMLCFLLWSRLRLVES
jgi:hypothetical protein